MLSRTGGGIGTRGPGEKKLETDFLLGVGAALPGAEEVEPDLADSNFFFKSFDGI